MTVIVWDGKTLAADKEMLSGYLKTPTVTKIRKSANGNLLGATGSGSMCAELFNWYEKGAIPADWPATNRDPKDCSHLLVINAENKKAYTYQCGPYPIELEGDKQAWGAGSEAGMAALLCGCDAKSAVEIVNQIVSGCGSGVDTLSL